jgi:5-methyltetrahydrofolate--homocysteine methyltransferase
MYKSKLGVTTALGVSNVSFGLPRRDILNSTFLAMALSAGLNMAIINPHDPRMKEIFLAAQVLMDYDKGSKAYISYAQHTNTQARGPAGDMTALQQIRTAVIQGEKTLIAQYIQDALAKKEDALVIVNQALIPAMEDIGTAYFKGEAFLPQVMMAAETMRNAFQELKKTMPEKDMPQYGTIVLATVKGDIHDLGKNIVGALMENNGFRVIDLGKDVSAENIVAAAGEYNAEIVGLSALMTTTMPEMEIVIDQLRQNNITAKVMVGGAVVTQEYADVIQADAYASDALDALKKAKALVSQ